MAGTWLITCARCCLAFGNKRKLFAHLASRHAAADLTSACPKCGRFVRTTFHGLEKHLERAHSDTVKQTPFACQKCPGRFETAARLRFHGKLVHGPAIFHCDKCTAIFRCSSSLSVHMQRHISNTDQPHICHICSRFCRSSVQLKAHIKTHSQTKAFRCAVCLAAFPAGRKTLLRDHLAKHHSGTVVKSFRCDICPFATDSKWHMAGHKRVYHSIVRFGCARGGEGDQLFATKTTLRRHQLHQHGVHGAWLENCSVCQACFVDKTELHAHAHMLIHSELQYRCCHCFHQSVNRKVLGKHIRIMHRSERNYQCAICSRIFKWMSCLEQHILSVHQNESPYKCNVCWRTFKWRLGLRRHRKVHDQARKRYACARCQRSFLQKRALVTHIMPYNIRKSRRKPDAELMRKRAQANAVATRCKVIV